MALDCVYRYPILHSMSSLRDLDEKVEALQAEIAKKQRAPPKGYDLESQVKKLVSLADEKVGWLCVHGGRMHAWGTNEIHCHFIGVCWV